MRFFYATILFLLTTYIFFWSMIFLIPSPKLYITEDITVTSESGVVNSQAKAVIERIKSDNKKTIYYFDTQINSKKSNALFIYSLLAFLMLLFVVIFFHKKSYVVFPLIASVIAALLACCMLWLFTNTIATDVYIDLQDIRTTYGGIKSLQFLSPFIFMEVVILAFGSWYQIP
jgi:hypothetical protein